MDRPFPLCGDWEKGEKEPVKGTGRTFGGQKRSLSKRENLLKTAGKTVGAVERGARQKNAGFTIQAGREVFNSEGTRKKNKKLRTLASSIGQEGFLRKKKKQQETSGGCSVENRVPLDILPSPQEKGEAKKHNQRRRKRKKKFLNGQSASFDCGTARAFKCGSLHDRWQKKKF